MYFEQEDVKRLLQDIRAAFSTSVIMFDTIPRWISRKTTSPRGMRISKNYVTPKMPWGINVDEISPVMRAWLGEDAIITEGGYGPMPRGMLRWIWGSVSLAPWLRNRVPSIVKIEF